jgi:hypothetical protein
MRIGAFYLPSLGRVEDIKKGMAGKQTGLYQMMLRELTEQLQYMEEWLLRCRFHRAPFPHRG